jgi:hypothetical protein
MGQSAAAAQAMSLPLHVALDTRLDGNAAAIAVERFAGAVVYRFDGDVTSLWFNTLERLWSSRAIATAGFTRHSEFFVLHTLARDHGYHVANSTGGADYTSWLLVPPGTD